ncbi:MAG: response regulator [Chitinophagaceae bacterium]|nr:response regulator [Chitinophagaceae bacterium]
MKTVLVIDDNPDIRENTAEILDLAGYKTFTAENGKKGVDLALKEKPDVIVCDIMMPELDGYGVLHLLRKNDETMHIPFIFLTAKTERGDFRKGMEMGADDYITKPFEDIELLNAIEVRLKKTAVLENKYASTSQGIKDFINDVKESGLMTQLTDQYDDISIATKFIRIITQNVKDKEQRLLSLAYSSLRKRVARALVDIHGKFNSEGENKPIEISREDIAHYVGTATESLIRTLSDFKGEKLIEIKEGKISISNIEKLRNLLY